jgi:hypothetical protein
MAFAVCEARTSSYPIASRIVKYVEPVIIQALTEQELLVDTTILSIYYALDSGVSDHPPYHNTPVIVELANGHRIRLLITLDMYEDALEIEPIFYHLHFNDKWNLTPPQCTSRDLAYAFGRIDAEIK